MLLEKQPEKNKWEKNDTESHECQIANKETMRNGKRRACYKGLKASDAKQRYFIGHAI